MNGMKSLQNYSLILLAVLGGILTWAYWPVFGDFAERWSSNPHYSQGYLVPVFAGSLLWLRRRHLSDGPLQPSWWGMPVLAAGLAVHLAGAFFYFDWFSAVSLLPVLGGVALLWGGATALRWSWPAIAFLAFMLPLP